MHGGMCVHGVWGCVCIVEGVCTVRCVCMVWVCVQGVCAQWCVHSGCVCMAGVCVHGRGVCVHGGAGAAEGT